VFCYGDGKPVRMRQLAAEEGLSLEDSYAYSDSASDIPMLRAVGHPVAVNPDAELARVAGTEGWDVLRFETLGRRLKIGAAVLAAAAAGQVGRRVVTRRVPA
jgi:phosphoserine phosphatase